MLLATLPAGARIVGVIADTTAKYNGGAVSAATLAVGTSVGGVQIIASHDVWTSAVTKGLLDADMGSSMTRAAAIQGSYMPSWTSTTPVYVYYTTTGGNISTLAQGTTTFYIITERFK